MRKRIKIEMNNLHMAEEWDRGIREVDNFMRKHIELYAAMAI